MSKRGKTKPWDKRALRELKQGLRVMRWLAPPVETPAAPAGMNGYFLLPAVQPEDARVEEGWRMYVYARETADPETFWLDGDRLRWSDEPDDFIGITVGGGPVDFLGGIVGRVETLLADGSVAVLTWEPGRMRETALVELADRVGIAVCGW